MKAINLRNLSEEYLNNKEAYDELPKNAPKSVKASYESNLRWLKNKMKGIK